MPTAYLYMIIYVCIYTIISPSKSTGNYTKFPLHKLRHACSSGFDQLHYTKISNFIRSLFLNVTRCFLFSCFILKVGSLLYAPM